MVYKSFRYVTVPWSVLLRWWRDGDILVAIRSFWLKPIGHHRWGLWDWMKMLLGSNKKPQSHSQSLVELITLEPIFWKVKQYWSHIQMTSEIRRVCHRAEGLSVFYLLSPTSVRTKPTVCPHKTVHHCHHHHQQPARVSLSTSSALYHRQT